VLAQHGAELWSQVDRVAGRHRLCLQLPTIQPEPPGAEASVPGRPVYYDFDLFHQAGQSTALDNLRLAELSYTVFDSETTGLAPADGDEIISIGAVRIVNGRLLEHETFDRLIKPRRAVSAESQRIHRITPQMLADQPPLEQVLPAFARFAEDTVLIAHNAAFDLRFLELARQRTGVRFDHPVLDTLLLSSLVHAGHHDRDHQLEQIAARLGLTVVGRHTALGDAIVTGEVFLKLLPLLAERGIHTLGQAREASQRSVYATLEY
jgi:DNA polymerase-3 subunit epsilon